MSTNSIKIGTRGSNLALYQANLVKDKLSEKFPDLQFEIVIISTKGDKVLDVALSKIGDKGLFTKELEVALFAGEVDLCVHSLKDLPTQFPEGAQLGAVLERAEFKDAWVSKDGLSLDEMTEEHVVATSSLRRKAQVHRINPKVKVVDIRGNVETRLRKMKEENHCDAMVMAGAGLIRLGYEKEISTLFDPEYFVSACGQGAIAIETREKDLGILDIVRGIHCENTYAQITAERSFLNELEGGCQIPIGAHAVITDAKLNLLALVAMPDGSKELRGTLSGNVIDAEKIGRELAQQLAKQGADKILEVVRDMNLK